MDTIQVVVLALIQGLTEFLPISSSAHLILPSQLLGWPDQGLAFDVAVHVGTLLAVIGYFRRDLWVLGRGCVTAVFERRMNSNVNMVLALCVGSIPAVVVGFLADNWIETHLRSQFVIALATIIFGVLLGVADRWPRMNQLQSNSGVTLPCAFLIGLAQATALIPGTSRSGVTMTAALLLGLGRVEAARFSFLLSIPIIAGAGLFQMLKVSSTPDAMEWSVFAWGVVLSGISAYFCIRLFLASIERMGMMPFVLYRLLLGTVLLLV